MFEEIVNFCISLQTWDWKLTSFVSILLPFVYTYIWTSWKAAQACAVAEQQPHGQKRAPTLPYAIPFLAHLFSFIADGGHFLSQAAKRYSQSTPVKVLLVPGISRYIISGPDMISALFRETSALSGRLDELTMMKNSLGYPPHSVAFYGADNSGYSVTPSADSAVKPENRTFFIIHRMLNTYLSGTSLTGITARFLENFATQIQEDKSISDDWVEIPDLHEFMQNKVMSAAINSMFGNHLIELNPSFIKDFWAWNTKVGRLFMSIPRWLDPQAYILRSKMLTSIKRWHNYAHEHFDCNKFREEDAEWEPYFGSKFSRARQSKFLEWAEFDETARAASDLGVIWAINANSVPAATWFLYEILRDPVLETNIRVELAAATMPPTSPKSVLTFDINKLCSAPRLQSIYAETLRLRVAILVSRQVQTVDFRFRGWYFKRGDAIAAVSSNEAQNENIWSQGGECNHPLHQFWADRFLIFPDDPRSGPLKQPKDPKPASASRSVAQKEDTGPRFSMEGLTTAWIPYSGGVRLCPGRHFAKQEIISASALLLASYDIELTNPGAKIDHDKNFYGFGTMPPKQKIKCRIRRRNAPMWRLS